MSDLDTPFLVSLTHPSSLPPLSTTTFAICPLPPPSASSTARPLTLTDRGLPSLPSYLAIGKPDGSIWIQPILPSPPAPDTTPQEDEAPRSSSGSIRSVKAPSPVIGSFSTGTGPLRSPPLLSRASTASFLPTRSTLPITPEILQPTPIPPPNTLSISSLPSLTVKPSPNSNPPPTLTTSQPRSRTPSISSLPTTTNRSHRRPTGFLPSSSSNLRNLPSTILTSSSTAELALPTPAQETELKSHLAEQAKDKGREREGNSLTVLTGLARRGLVGVHGRTEENHHHPGSTAISAAHTPAGGSPRHSSPALPEALEKELQDLSTGLDQDLALQTREAKQRLSLQETSTRDLFLRRQSTPLPPASPRTPTRALTNLPPAIRVLLQGFGRDGGGVKRLCPVLGVGRAGGVVALSGSGWVGIVGEGGGCGEGVDLNEWRGGREGAGGRLREEVEWSEVQSFVWNEDSYILATGHPIPDILVAKETTHVVILEVKPELGLIGLGGFTLEERGVGVVISLEGEEPMLYHAGTETTTLRTIHLKPIAASEDAEAIHHARSHTNLTSLFHPSSSPFPSRPPSRAGSIREGKDPKAEMQIQPSIAISKLFTRRPKKKDGGEKEGVRLGEPRIVGGKGGKGWEGVRVKGRRGVGWGKTGVEVLRVWGGGLEGVCSVPAREGAEVLGAEIAGEGEVLILDSLGGFIISTTQSQDTERLTTYQLLKTLDGPAAAFDHLLITLKENDVYLSDVAGSAPPLCYETYQTASSGDGRAGVVFPVGGDKVLVSNSVSGTLSSQDLAAFAKGTIFNTDLSTSDRGRSFAITCIKRCSRLGRSNGLLLAGDVAGYLHIWDQRLSEIARVSVAFSPIRAILVAVESTNALLKAAVLVVGEDGSIGAVDVESQLLLYIIPASRHKLTKVYLSQDSMLLAYSNGKARVWNLETLEFRRSTGFDAAEEMLAEKTWDELSFHETLDENQGKSQLLSSLGAETHALGVDLLSPSWAPGPGRESTSLNAARSLLAASLTLGLDDVVDDVCVKQLGVPASSTQPLLGLLSSNGCISVGLAGGKYAWTISPLHTATRQLLIISLLMPFLSSSEFERSTAQVVTLYAVILPDLVGEDFVDADINFFAKYYGSSNVNVRQAARVLFDSRIGRMEDTAIIAAAESQVQYLTSPRADGKRATAALILIAGIAIKKFSLLSTTTLKDVATFLLKTLANPTSPNRYLAIDFCCSGFEVWQSYVDPMELVRSIFRLASQKDVEGAIGLSAHARLAVLQLAAAQSTSFISTLSMDILDAQTVEERTSIMKLCVFVCRKKPVVLYSSLSRLVEAVVHSLDPNRLAMRESVQQTATVILNELVKTFPAIDFCHSTQKLAVGTHEGAVIMYDLKTASRIYVLETHFHQVTAISFSPDGRRLVTVSLDERKLTIWKTGSSFSSLFTVGGPPRQGSGPGQPFKTIEFAIAEASSVDPATGQSEIVVTWPSDRSACLEIGLNKMTFVT